MNSLTSFNSHYPTPPSSKENNLLTPQFHHENVVGTPRNSQARQQGARRKSRPANKRRQASRTFPHLAGRRWLFAFETFVNCRPPRGLITVSESEDVACPTWEALEEWRGAVSCPLIVWSGKKVVLLVVSDRGKRWVDVFRECYFERIGDLLRCRDLATWVNKFNSTSKCLLDTIYMKKIFSFGLYFVNWIIDGSAVKFSIIHRKWMKFNYYTNYLYLLANKERFAGGGFRFVNRFCFKLNVGCIYFIRVFPLLPFGKYPSNFDCTAIASFSIILRPGFPSSDAIIRFKVSYANDSYIENQWHTSYAESLWFINSCIHNIGVCVCMNKKYIDIFYTIARIIWNVSRYTCTFILCFSWTKCGYFKMKIKLFQL